MSQHFSMCGIETILFWQKPLLSNRQHNTNELDAVNKHIRKWSSSWFLMLVTLSITSLARFFYIVNIICCGSLSFCFSSQHENDIGREHLSKLLFYFGWNCYDFSVVTTSNCLFDCSCLRLWCSNNFCAFSTFDELFANNNKPTTRVNARNDTEKAQEIGNATLICIWRSQFAHFEVVLLCEMNEVP